MPHIIIEHSADMKNSNITSFQKTIQAIVKTTEDNFDPDQCKARAFSFKDYLVGHPDQTTSSFIHITFKLLVGRSLEVRQILSKSISDAAQSFIKDQKLESTRCDISVDIVEMDRDTYQKTRIEYCS